MTLIELFNKTERAVRVTCRLVYMMSDYAGSGCRAQFDTEKIHRWILDNIIVIIEEEAK